MRYTTHLLDGQTGDRRFGISWDDLKSVDDYRAADAFGDDPDVDFRIAGEVRKALESPAGQFIVVLKRGNHNAHQRNYPPGRGPWQPAFDGEVSRADRDAALTNTYDNAVLYNVDGFFRALLNPDGTLPRTTVLYTSDHGEVLSGEGSEPLTRWIAWGVIAVPLVMGGDVQPAVDTGYRASHHNIFATVLDLMHVPATIRQGSLYRSLLTARETDRDPRFALDAYIMGDETADLGDFDKLSRPAALGVDPPRSPSR
jgi:arylsulfatase A-like enzyme